MLDLLVLPHDHNIIIITYQAYSLMHISWHFDGKGKCVGTSLGVSAGKANNCPCMIVIELNPHMSHFMQNLARRQGVPFVKDTKTVTANS